MMGDGDFVSATTLVMNILIWTIARYYASSACPL